MTQLPSEEEEEDAEEKAAKEIKSFMSIDEYYDITKKLKELKGKQKFLRELFITEYGSGTHKIGQYSMTIKENLVQKRLDADKIRTDFTPEQLKKYEKKIKYNKVTVKKTG